MNGTASSSLDAGRASSAHDIVIVGGGLVGATLAIALEHSGLGVALVEASPADALPPVFDQRNLSFADATVNALDALGVLQQLQSPGAPIRRIHVSRRGDLGRVRLDAHDYARSEFGRVVVARDFGLALEARLARLTGLTRYRRARFIGIEDGDASVRHVRIVDAAGERTLATRLLVGADGTGSAVRGALHIKADRRAYAQTLFVARVRAERTPDGTAYERFGDEGPTALLPRNDRHYGLVHGVADAHADAVAALDDAGFLAHAQDAFGWRVGRWQSVGPRSRHSALSLRAAQLSARRGVLVGNAAQTLHPIGAQGFNLGLRDALTLAEVAERHRADPGSDAALATYANRRREDHARTFRFSDGLARLTANDAALLHPLRSLGLLALDSAPWLQAMLVGGAMGYRGDDVPRLCRSAD